MCAHNLAFWVIDFGQSPANPVSPSSHRIPHKNALNALRLVRKSESENPKKDIAENEPKKQIKKARAEGNLLHERLQKIFQKIKKCKASGQQLRALECRLNCAHFFRMMNDKVGVCFEGKIGRDD